MSSHNRKEPNLMRDNFPPSNVTYQLVVVVRQGIVTETTPKSEQRLI